MPMKNSLKPGPSSPWPICLAPCSTRSVARSTLVLSAAPATPPDRATTMRNAGMTHRLRSLRVMTHLLELGWLALPMLAPRGSARPRGPRGPGLDVPQCRPHRPLSSTIAREKQVTDTDDNPSPSIKRRLAAILAADIAGYSRLMGADEAATVRDLKAHQAIVLPLVGRYGGRIIDTAGDGILAEFPSVINATECAVEIQTIMATRNDAVPESRRMRFRIGINLGDVIHDETRIYGDGINIAARLEALAPPGGVLVSNTVHDQVRGKLPFTFEDVGERQVKNIEQPVRMYKLHIPG